MIASVSGAAAFPRPSDSGLGPRAGEAVFNQWSICMTVAGLPPAQETGHRSFLHGHEGLTITVGTQGPSFVVPDRPLPPIASPSNAEARALIRRGEVADPGCPGSRPTTRP